MGEQIIILGPAHPYRGGIVAFNQNLALTLQDLGHEVFVFNFKFQYPDFIYPGDEQLSHDPPPPLKHNLRLVHSLNPLNWLAVRRKIKKIQPNRIICSFWLPLLSPCFSSILHGFKHHAEINGILHNVIPHESRTGDKVLTQLFIKQLSKITVLSKSVAEDFIQWKPKRTQNTRLDRLFHPVYDHYGEIVPMPEARAHLGLDQNKKYILFFGFIREYKGLDILIEALAKVKDEDIHLIIAGEYYDDKSKYLDMIQRLNLNDRTHIFDNYILDSDIRYYFSSADFLALPYRSATQSGVSQIAIHFGKPVISTDVGGIKEYILDGINGKIIDAHSESLALTIGKLYEEDELMSLSEGQLNLRDKWSWKKFAQDIISS